MRRLSILDSGFWILDFGLSNWARMGKPGSLSKVTSLYSAYLEAHPPLLRLTMVLNGIFSRGNQRKTLSFSSPTNSPRRFSHNARDLGLLSTAVGMKSS